LEIERNLEAIFSVFRDHQPAAALGAMLRVPENADTTQSDQVLAQAPLCSLPLCARRVPVVAIDCGLARLGETAEGVFVAARAAAVRVNAGGEAVARLFRTGPLLLPTEHTAAVLCAIGKQLGDPTFYVHVDGQGNPTGVKQGAADGAAHYADRIRAWLERTVQAGVADTVEGGVILIDGSATLHTRDVPSAYLRNIVSVAHQHGNAVVAVSKTSELDISGRAVRFWLHDAKEPAYRALTPLIQRGSSQRAARVLGDVYAVMFRAASRTYRVDIAPAPGQATSEALQLVAALPMRSGYPDALVRAHSLSFYCTPAVVALRAQACATYGLRPHAEPSLTPAFAPFAGRFK
jgi:hypothetical protein